MIGSLYRFRFDLYRFRFTSAAAAVVIAACGGSGEAPEAPPGIAVSATAIEAEPAGETVSAEVSNTGGGTLVWSAGIPAGVNWARFAGGSTGTDRGTIEVEVDANTGAAREFELTVTADNTDPRTFIIRQAEAPPVIDLTAAASKLEGDGGSIRLQVRNSGYGTMPWTASLAGDVDWAYIESGEAGTDSGEIVVRYGLNGGADRELEVTVTAEAASNSPESLPLSQDWFGTSACTYPDARAEVFKLIETRYYFNDEPEQQAKYDRLFLDDFSTIDALLDEIRWMPETHDRGFTYWLTKEESDMLFQGVAYIFGFRMRLIVNELDEPQYLEVLDVYEGSPAGDAGLARGDRILALNGEAVEDLNFEQIQIQLGPNEEGYEVEVEVETLKGFARAYRMAKRLVEIRTVEHSEVFERTAGNVGYLHFRTFFGDANERLLEEFAKFSENEVRHVIIDLRYNGGGSVEIAHGLATLIGGPELFESDPPTVLAKMIHNDLLERSDWNQTTHFGCDVYRSPAHQEKCRKSSLRDLENVVFITSGGSASASELVITALQPHKNVTLVGERTYGKPVGQYGFGFCLTNPADNDSGVGFLWPVSFATVNSAGFEEYYDGIPVTEGCEAPDDLGHQLGDAQEGRIAAALRFIESETGSCAPASASRLASQDATLQINPARDPVAQFFGH